MSDGQAAVVIFFLGVSVGSVITLFAFALIR